MRACDKPQLDDELDFPPAFVDLFKLLMQVALVGHTFACLWMFVTVVNDLGSSLEEIPYGPNWWQAVGFDGTVPMHIYVASLYVRGGCVGRVSCVWVVLVRSRMLRFARV